MNSDLNNYFSTINKLINKQNGKQIAKELDLKKALLSNSSFVKNIKNNIKTIDGIIALSNNNLNNCLTNVISQFLASFLALSFNNYEDSFKYSQLSYNSLMTYFGSGNSENSSTWVIPIISKLSNNLRFVSFEGDNKGINSHLKYSNEAIDTLTRGFAIAVKDRTSINESYSRRLALFSMANILFKYYFQFHKLHLCEKLIQVIEGYKNVPPLVDMKNTSLKLFNVVDIITYKYYAGKLKLYNDAFVESREFLTFVLKNLPLNCISNRQKVLVILIPLQMIVGIMPTEKISIVYGLHELYGLSKAIKTGDIKSFNDIMNLYMTSFIKLGIYLLLEHCRFVLYRNLLKRIHTITSSTRINLRVVENIFISNGEIKSIDQIEGIITNLICSVRIKGYLRHDKKYLVLSNSTPFPRLK